MYKSLIDERAVILKLKIEWLLSMCLLLILRVLISYFQFWLGFLL